MYNNRFALFLCVFLLTAGLPTPVLAAVSPSLPKQITPLVETLSAGSSFSCWIREDGTLKCWGLNNNGQSTPPAGTFTQISAGTSGSICGLRSDGSIACWPDGSLLPPAGTFAQISVGAFHSCALKSDGSLTCWGKNDNGQATPPAGTFTQVSAGLNYTCAVQSDSNVVCWGINGNGQSTPPAGSFTQVSAGWYHTCGVKSDNTVACWGDQSTPPGGTFTQVSVGASYSCALKSDGSLTCWGKNDDGQATPPAGTFTQISAGHSHNCALRSNGVPLCWGNNYNGELNPVIITGHTPIAFTKLSYTDGTPKLIRADSNGDYSIGVPYGWSGVVTPSFDEASFLPASQSYTNLTTDQTGQDYIRAVIISGFAGAAGATLSYMDGTPKTTIADSNGDYSLAVPYNWSGTITPSLTGFRFKPANSTYTNLLTSQIYENYISTSGVAFAQVSAGYAHTCWLKNNGRLTCWGNDDVGQATPLVGEFVQVSAGGSSTCALRSNGMIACWGNNYSGKLPPAGVFTQVSAGESHDCALRSNGTAVCWGNNDFHQSSPIPAGTFVQISAGIYTTCGRRSNGSVTCWGETPTRFPPDGTFMDLDINLDGCAIAQNNTPVCWPQYHIDPPYGIAATQVSVGSGFACGLKIDGTVACWGRNLLPPAGTFTQVSAGGSHACGLKRDGSVSCWGSNYYAQLELDKLSFISDGFYDGYILESTETSGIGGNFNASSRTFPIGDDLANRQYRVILSFRTKFIPDSAIIKSVTVKIMKEGSAKGSNPFSVLGNLLIDIRKGPFGGNSILKAGDFNAAASAARVGIFNKVPVANWYTATLNAVGRNQINKIGSTELRLYFSRDDNNNYSADLINFLSGHATSYSGLSAEVRPILIVQYALP